jgi:hemoglobin-like flavoprotein
MTPDQIALVQQSFAKVTPIAGVMADLFYDRLFEIAPELRPLFAADLTEQKKKLVSMLSSAVYGLSTPDKLMPTVKALGARHAAYKVTPDHYPIVGSALLWALREGLGDEFTPDVEEAWAKVYGAVSAAMLEGASEAA